MNLVVDTNIIIHYLFVPDDRYLIPDFEKYKTFAPDILYAELGNTLWKMVRFGNLDHKTAHTKMNLGLKLISKTVNGQAFKEEAFNIALANNISYYDSLYLVLAMKLNCKLATLDKKLNSTAQRLACSFLEL